MCRAILRMGRSGFFAPVAAIKRLHARIYIYIYICACVCVCVCVRRVHTPRPFSAPMRSPPRSRGTSLDSSTFVCRHAVALFPRDTCLLCLFGHRPILGMKFARLSRRPSLSLSLSLSLLGCARSAPWHPRNLGGQRSACAPLSFGISAADHVAVQ